MATQTPLLLLDNLFDTVVQYPAALLGTTSEAVGREATRVADYRRERSWWQAASSGANHMVRVDLGVGNSGSPDSCWLDRGHNLAGLVVEIRYSDDDAAYTTWISRTLPAATVIGGDPTSTWAQTEEGAAYALFTAHASPHRYWQVRIPATLAPIIPGIILGVKSQLINFSNIYDDDESTRKIRSEESEAGYLASGRAYSYRTLQLGLELIGDTEYDATIRKIRRLMFDQAAPAFVAMNYGLYPERGWLYQYDGTKWGLPKTGVYRKGRIQLREVGQVVL